MKNTIRVFGIIALVAVIGFSMASCGPEEDSSPIPVVIQGTTSDGWRYYGYEGEGSFRIDGYEGSETNITIPSQIVGVPVKYIGNYAFENKNLTGVTIPDSITQIGDRAFTLNPLTSITIGASVQMTATSFPAGPTYSFMAVYTVAGRVAGTYARGLTTDWSKSY
jgi:hypothetical protein